MATKNNRRTIMTKRILKDVLLELMQEKPISRITIKEICELSDMSRSTFYLHYQDQFELLEDIEKEVLEKTFESLQSIDTEVRTIGSIEAFLHYVKENKATFGVLLCQMESHAFQQGMLKRVQAYVESMLPQIGGMINDSNHKVVKSEKYLYSFVMQGCLSVLVDWINNEFDISEKELAQLIFHVCKETMY